MIADHLKDTYLPTILSMLEGRNFACERGVWPCLDSGDYRDGGHLPDKHLEPIRVFLEALGWTPKEAARSGNVWQAGIIAHGCAAALRYAEPDADLRKRLWSQMEVAVAFIAYQGPAPAWDAKLGQMRTPEPGRLWDDVAPGQKVEGAVCENDLPCRIGWGQSTADGVGIRFVVSGLLAYAKMVGIRGGSADVVADDIIKAANKDKQAMREWAMESWHGVQEWPE